MLKCLKNLIIINILAFIFSVSASAAPKCELNLDNLNDYKSSLIGCLDKDIKEFDTKLLNDLSDNKTNFFSKKSLNKEKLVVNQKLILSEKFDDYLKKTVNKNYLNIYGIHQELNILKTNYNISNNKLDKLISNSLVEFLDTSIKNQNGKSGLNRNTLGGLLTAGVFFSVLDSEKEEEKLVFSLSSGSSDEDAGETITLTATTRQAVTSDTTINLSFGGTALKGTDYSFSQNYITISSGSDTGSHNFTISDDSTYEGNETIIFNAGLISGDSEYENASASTTFTINENESAPTVTLTSSASSVAENGSALTLTATLSGTTHEDVTVSLSTSGTGTEGTDYSNISDITISAGDTTGTTSFTPTDDSMYEGSETGIVSIDTVSGGSATENGTQAVTITITDNESAPTVTLTSSASSIAENSGSSLTLTATLSGTTSEDVTVSLSTSGTGTEGTDYGTVSDITISSGSTTGTASFTPTDDSTYEGNETGIIAIDTVSGGSATESGTQSVTLTITDNESAPTVTLSSSASSVAENGSALTLTATLSNATTEDVTVTFSTSGTGSEGTDYSNISNITISAGDTTGTTSFTPTDDSTFEGDETGIIAIDTVSGGSATESGTQSVTITISEDDSGPTFSISDVTTSDESAANATFTVTMSTASSVAATVDYATSNGTATAGSDYTAASGTLTFSAGQTSKTFTVAVNADSTYEGDETVTITLSNATKATISDSSATLTITDDESAPTVTLDPSAYSIAENGSNITLTATLSGTTHEDVTVSLSTSGTGTEGTDYANISDITISAGQTTGTASFTPTDDTTYEGNETGIVAIDTVSGGSATENGTQVITITITEDDSAPTVTLTSSASSIAENAGSSLTLTATLSIATTEDVTVSLSTSGTGTEGTDYGTVSDITISAGQTEGTASFTPTDDTTYEGNETGIVAIDSVSGGSATENGTQAETLTITDNESAPTVTLISSESSIAENAGSSLTLTATLSNATTEDVTVGISTSGTATENTDYATISDITITAGQTTGTASFTPTDDSTFEGNENAAVAIASVSGGSASESGTQSVTITINEDDSGPSLSINDVTTSDESAANATFTVTLSTASSSAVTVDYATSNGTATASSDYTAASGTLTFSAGQTSKTFNVPVLADSVYEGDETVTITLSDATNASISDSTGTLTITDDESAPTVTLTTSASSVAENGSNLTLTATLSGTTHEDVTVSLSTSGTSTEGTDYASISDITISAGGTTGTAVFNPTEDTTFESSETAIVAINSVSGGSATEDGTQSVTITITNAGPTVTLTSSASSVSEKGSNLTLTATLSAVTSEDVAVVISTSGTSDEGTDYASISDITISAGQTEGTAAFNPTEDTLFEDSETAIIDISVSGSGASENGTQRVTITITDKALDSGTQNTYNASTATTWLSDIEFTNSGFNDSIFVNTTGGEDPYKTINLHKALAYTNGSGAMRGSGEVIAIMDGGFQVNGLGSNSSTHIEFQGKTITTYDTTTFSTYSHSNSHGTGVAAIAAGTYGTGSVMGVAPEASLHLHSYGQNFQPTWWATGTSDAESDGAVVQNNSWGYDDDSASSLDISDATTYKTNNSATGAATLVYYQSQDTDGDGYYDIGAGSSVKTWTEANWNTYVSALDSFQDTGVIVWALSNQDGKTDADISAGLPELFTELKEAWINVANIDVEGTTSKTYTLESAPCGSTAQYCLGADGHGITTAGGSTVSAINYDVTVSGTSYDYQTGSGTSFAAPQVSGAIALLATHFPNHSPEQLADRLLASAYNDWAAFGVDGTVTFGNGVVHGYSTDYGHGVMDIYAALQPITTNQLGRSIYTQNSNSGNTQLGQNLDRTFLTSSRSFGDAIKNAVDGILINKFYDAMGSQFSYNVGDHIILPESNTTPVIRIENEINNLTSANNLNDRLNLKDDKYKNIIKQKTLKEDEDFKSVLALTLGSGAIPSQSFFNFDQYAFNGITDYNLPFLNPNDPGVSLNSMIELDKLKFSISTTTPMKENDDTYLGDQRSLLTSLEYDFNDNLSFGLLNGIVNESDDFLGLQGEEALSFKDSSNVSKFNSIKLQKNILDDISLTITGSYAVSEYDGNSNSMIGSGNDIKSDSYSININKANLFKNDNFAFSISQPNRVYSGELSFRLSDLVDTDGNIEVTEVPVELKPSGRQIDTTVSYAYDFNEALTLTSKITHTNEPNHTKGNKDAISSFLGLKHNNLKLGFSQANGFEKTDFMLDFKKQF